MLIEDLKVVARLLRQPTERNQAYMDRYYSGTI
jgi:hypothetical protein